MKFKIEREKLIKPLQMAVAPLSARPSLPILGHVLLQINENILELTATDLEIEIGTRVMLIESSENGSITVPAKKFLDICRSLPMDSVITLEHKENRLIIQANRSRFSLSTLPADQFPNLENWQSETTVTLRQDLLKNLIESIQFSMANQDVRYYLNGMFFEIEDGIIRSVATDGHRLAVCVLPVESTQIENKTFILPRKGVLELNKLLNVQDDMVTIELGGNNLKISLPDLTFTSKLVDGKYPDYRRVFPKNADKILTCSCETLKQSLSRVAILSNEKFRGIRLLAENNQLKISANNPEKEEAEEVIDVNYAFESLEIGFNVTYLLDILNSLNAETVKLSLLNSATSVLVENMQNQTTQYVVMPMRL